MFVPFLEAALFFHPSLQLFVSVNNIKRENSKMLTRRWLKRGETNMDVGMREESDVTLPGLNCRLNVINKFNNHTAREEKCRMVKCLFGLKQLPCDYDYIAYDENCTFNTRLPISRNLHEVYLSNVLYPEYGVGLLWSRAWSMVMELNATTPADGHTSRLRTCFKQTSSRKWTPVLKILFFPITC